MGGTRRSARQLTRCVDEGQGTMVVEGGRRPALWSEVMAEAWREALSDAEVRELLEMRDWRSWLSIAVDWGTIGVALALVARWPNPLTMVVALFVIGRPPLGLPALMPEAAHPALYLLWVGAWLTTYSLAMRLRSIAEHGMVPDPADPLRNTRTTLARWWERLLLAPNRVNYHLEHHLVMTVPHYNLPRMHRLLRARGVLEDACVTRGYLDVLRLASAAPATS